MAWIDAGKSGTGFASVPIVSELGVNLAGAVATNPAFVEPTLPFIMVAVSLTGNDELPGVYQYEAVIHLKSDATRESATRQSPDLILADLSHRISLPSDSAAAWGDGNALGGAFIAFANKPVGTETRPAYRRPLHVYDLWMSSQPTEFDGHEQHDQIIITGTCQDMNSHDDP